MIKYISIFLLGILFTAMFLIAFQKCERKPSNLEEKSNQSLKENSIQAIKLAKIKKDSDSIVNIQKAEIELLQQKNKVLAKSYSELRTIVKTLKPVKIDSSNQVVDSVNAIAYNAAINSGVLCDELLSNKDDESNRKDSIISQRDIELEAEKEAGKATTQALNDSQALNEKTEKKLKRAKLLNKKIPLIAVLSALGGAVLILIAL